MVSGRLLSAAAPGKDITSRVDESCSWLTPQPLRQFHRDPFWSGEKHQLAIMKLHDLVAQLDATRAQLANLGFNVFDSKTDMIETQLVEPGNVTIPYRLRVTIPQELNLNTRYGV